MVATMLPLVCVAVLGDTPVLPIVDFGADVLFSSVLQTVSTSTQIAFFHCGALTSEPNHVSCMRSSFMRLSSNVWSTLGENGAN